VCLLQVGSRSSRPPDPLPASVAYYASCVPAHPVQPASPLVRHVPHLATYSTNASSYAIYCVLPPPALPKVPVVDAHRGNRPALRPLATGLPPREPPDPSGPDLRHITTLIPLAPLAQPTLLSYTPSFHPPSTSPTDPSPLLPWYPPVTTLPVNFPTSKRQRSNTPPFDTYLHSQLSRPAAEPSAPLIPLFPCLHRPSVTEPPNNVTTLSGPGSPHPLTQPSTPPLIHPPPASRRGPSCSGPPSHQILLSIDPSLSVPSRPTHHLATICRPHIYSFPHNDLCSSRQHPTSLSHLAHPALYPQLWFSLPPLPTASHHSPDLPPSAFDPPFNPDIWFSFPPPHPPISTYLPCPALPHLHPTPAVPFPRIVQASHTPHTSCNSYNATHTSLARAPLVSAPPPHTCCYPPTPSHPPTRRPSRSASRQYLRHPTSQPGHKDAAPSSHMPASHPVRLSPLSLHPLRPFPSHPYQITPSVGAVCYHFLLEAFPATKGCPPPFP